MVYPPHWLLRFEGNFDAIGGSNNNETWSCGIRCTSPDADIDEDAILTANAKAWMTILVANNFTSQIVWGTSVKLNKIGPDGKYAEDATTHEYDASEWGGGNIVGGAAAIVEPQRSLAVSWTTAWRRGRAHRGRIYLPAYSTAVNGQLQITNAPTVATMGKNLIASINAVPSLKASVVSGLGAGGSHPITGVEVGSRVDTQRRRRAQLVETYTLATQ
jgi:hypothetical protein